MVRCGFYLSFRHCHSVWRLVCVSSSSRSLPPRSCSLHCAQMGEAAKAYGSVLPKRFMALLGPRFLPGGAPRAALRFLSCSRFHNTTSLIIEPLHSHLTGFKSSGTEQQRNYCGKMRMQHSAECSSIICKVYESAPGEGVAAAPFLRCRPCTVFQQHVDAGWTEAQIRRTRGDVAVAPFLMPPPLRFSSEALAVAPRPRRGSLPPPCSGRALW